MWNDQEFHRAGMLSIFPSASSARARPYGHRRAGGYHHHAAYRHGIGGIDFSDFFIALDGNSYASLKTARDAGAAVIGYGVFLNAVIKFLIVAFAVFLLVKGVNKLQAKLIAQKAAEPVPPTKTETLLAEIRDLLKNG